jgi:hypothetical protein
MLPKVTAGLPTRQQEGEEGEGRPVTVGQSAEFRHARAAMKLFIAFDTLISWGPMR